MKFRNLVMIFGLGFVHILTSCSYAPYSLQTDNCCSNYKRMDIYKFCQVAKDQVIEYIYSTNNEFEKFKGSTGESFIGDAFADSTLSKKRANQLASFIIFYKNARYCNLLECIESNIVNGDVIDFQVFFDSLKLELQQEFKNSNEYWSDLVLCGFHDAIQELQPQFASYLTEEQKLENEYKRLRGEFIELNNSTYLSVYWKMEFMSSCDSLKWELLHKTELVHKGIENEIRDRDVQLQILLSDNLPDGPYALYIWCFASGADRDRSILRILKEEGIWKEE